jgi:signal transduction histidine kinase
LPLGAGAGAIATLIAFVALVVMYREIKPLRQLARAVDRIDLSGETIPLPDTRTQSREIKALVTAFDRLQTRLHQVLQGRMAMLGGISHDVRTFATRLRLRVDQIPDDAERDRAIANINDMILLLDDALLAARVSGATDLQEELVDMAEIVRAEIEDRQATGASVDFAGDRVGHYMVIGDRVALRRIVTNLIGNALKYGKAAHVAISSSSAQIAISVEDDGPGVPAELIDSIIEPFVRAETSRGRDTGGAGLGLAIVRNLIEAHGGSLELRNAKPRGLRATARLPAFRP